MVLPFLRALASNEGEGQAALLLLTMPRPWMPCTAGLGRATGILTTFWASSSSFASYYTCCFRPTSSLSPWPSRAGLSFLLLLLLPSHILWKLIWAEILPNFTFSPSFCFLAAVQCCCYLDGWLKCECLCETAYDTTKLMLGWTSWTRRCHVVPMFTVSVL